MVDSNLLEIAKQELGKGRNLDEIRNLLSQANYPKETVDEIMKELRPKLNKNLIYISCGIGLIAILGLVFFLFSSGDSEDTNTKSSSETLARGLDSKSSDEDYSCGSILDLSAQELNDIGIESRTSVKVIGMMNDEKCYLKDRRNFYEFSSDLKLLTKFEIEDEVEDLDNIAYLVKDGDAVYIFNSEKFAKLPTDFDSTKAVSNNIVKETIVVIEDKDAVYTFNIETDEFNSVQGLDPSSFREDISTGSGSIVYFKDTSSLYTFDSKGKLITESSG